MNKEPLLKSVLKYDSISKIQNNIVSDSQREIVKLNEQIKELESQRASVLNRLKQAQQASLEANAKSKAVQELLDNNELFN